MKLKGKNSAALRVWQLYKNFEKEAFQIQLLTEHRLRVCQYKGSNISSLCLSVLTY